MAASLHLILYPLVRAIPRSNEYSTWFRPVSDAIRIIGSFLPDSFAVWINAYARNPGRFLLSALIVGVLTWLSSIILAGKINDNMRGIWRSTLAPPPSSLLDRSIFALRSSALYQVIHTALKRQIAPAFFALVFLYVGFALVSHLLFDFEDSAGLICRDSYALRQLAPGETSPEIRFDTKDICKATGIVLEQGGRFQITLRQTKPWLDGDISTTIGGFYSADLEWPRRALMFLAWPLKRTFIRPWFRVIARTGSTGNEENFLDPDSARPTFLQESFVPGRSGELFMYVNDAVTALPWLQNIFYKNNDGEATVTVKRCKDRECRQ